MKRFEIEGLSEAELTELNHRIVERIRFLREVRAHARMAEFAIGDRVAFQPDGVTWVEGILTRYNRKTVTVHTDAGRRWNVSPGFLRKLAPVVDVPTSRGGTVVPMKRRPRTRHLRTICHRSPFISVEDAPARRYIHERGTGSISRSRM